MNALDSTYEWGIDPLNQGSLSPGQRLGLASLAPQAGYGLARPQAPQPLDPAGAFPLPQYSSEVTDYNTAEQGIGQDIATAQAAWPANHFGGQSPEEFTAYLQKLSGEAEGLPGPFAWAAQGAGTPGSAPTPDLNPAAKPYFDPNYPNESMLALKNWLAPQVEDAAATGLNANGLGYSGVKDYAYRDIQSELNQLSPAGTDPSQAQADDFARNYGPGMANALIEGGQIPGAQPIAGGGSTGPAQLLMNPAAGNPDQNSPLYALMQGGTMYPSAGYFYNPAVTPDSSRYPWLANATSPTSGTSGQAA